MKALHPVGFEAPTSCLQLVICTNTVLQPMTYSYYCCNSKVVLLSLVIKYNKLQIRLLTNYDHSYGSLRLMTSAPGL